MYTAKKKRWHQKRYSNRLRNGLCPICGGKRTGEWITCESCLAKHRVYQKTRPPGYSTKGINEYRKRCRKAGICYGCGVSLREDNHKKCEKCREKDNKRNAKRYALLCLQDGTCVQCKSDINVGIYRKCPTCREKDRIRQKNAYYLNN